MFHTTIAEVDDGTITIAEEEEEVALRNTICILNPFLGSKPKDWLDLINTLYILLSDNFSITFPEVLTFDLKNVLFTVGVAAPLLVAVVVLLIAFECKFNCFKFRSLEFWNFVVLQTKIKMEVVV